MSSVSRKIAICSATACLIAAAAVVVAIEATLPARAPAPSHHVKAVNPNLLAPFDPPLTATQISTEIDNACSTSKVRILTFEFVSGQTFSIRC